ncbi:glycoside hydrolase family 15 protein [Dinghuibacter silviterrae]|nr:glycoside hydrolase family 15 protein [Dinghuibacter silviterrae]
MTDPKELAPGAPGSPPYRAKSPLSGVGTALSPTSKVTFCLSEGIVSEVGFPDAGSPCLSSLEWIVTDGAAFFSQEQRHTLHETAFFEEGIPGYRLVNTCLEGKYRITKEVLTDPVRDTFLQKTRLVPLAPLDNPLRLFLTLNPCIGGDSALHDARVSRYKGQPLLVAQKGAVTLAVLCSHPLKHTSVGYAGISDGWLDLAAHQRMTRFYERAEGGHVSLTAEVEPGETDIIVAIGLGQNEREAAAKAWASLLDGFDTAKERFVGPWRTWQQGLSPMPPMLGSALPAGALSAGAHVKTGALALRALESKAHPGALVSSGGVRPRDLAAAFDAFQALGAREDAQRILAYLMAVQEERGFWAMLLHPDGSAASGRVARDQVAQVILMVDACRRTFQLSPARMQRYWPLVWTAAAYLVGGGPEPEADRWDGAESLSLHTLCATVAALLAAADMADERGQPGVATYCRKTADYLHEHIDPWTYIRVGPGSGPDRISGYYAAAGQPGQKASGPASADVLSLVRYGLRAADDPRVIDTLKVVDANARRDADALRDADARPGTAEAQPAAAPLLLTAERALYELSAGNKNGALALLQTLEAQAPSGFFPDKTGHLPDLRTHAEYIRLCCALKAEHAPEVPRFTTERYIRKQTTAPFDLWRIERPCPRLAPDKKLRIELPSGALIHWTDDDWATKQHTLTRDTRLGVHVAELSPHPGARQVIFTFFWLTTERWENRNYTVPVGG